MVKAYFYSYNFQRRMATFNIRFSATCETKFGQRVAICGNLPELGSWEISRGLLLQTDEKKYPVWTTESCISIKQGYQLEFKLCVLDGALKLVRWQEIKGNRQLIPKNSLEIEFSESDIKTRYTKMDGVNTSSFDVRNPQHADNAVINGWGSDTSSNQDMLEHQENDEEDTNSLLLAQFAAELKKAVATQRQEHHLTLQPQPEMQQHNQLQFGDCSHHHYNTHYFHADVQLDKHNIPQPYNQNERIIILLDHDLDSFKLNRKDEVSVFHLLGRDNSQLVNQLRRIRSRWRDLSLNHERGITAVYLEESIEESDLKDMLYEQVDAFVCKNYSHISDLIETFSKMKYIVKNRNKDEFIVDLDTARQLKIIYYPNETVDYVQNFEESLDFVKKKIMSGFYFSFDPRQFQSQLRDTLSFIKLNKDYSLIVLNLNKLDDLLPKTINEIVHLPSLCSKIIIFVITRERFPKNIQHRISVSRNKMIFINAHGQVYANSDEILNICHYIQISQLKFDENIDIVLENLGTGIKQSKKSSWNQVQIEFSNDLLGRLLKERALKCISDVNKKSIAKIVAEDHGNRLMLMPFCLHHSFLTQVIMRIYINRLKTFEKGLVISIDGTDLKSLKSLKAPNQRQLNIKFLKFYLHEDDQSSCYTCNPIKEHQMQKMIEIIANEIEEDTKPDPYRRNEVLSDIKNLR